MKVRIESVMKRAVRTCGPGDTLNVPAQMMWEADCGCVPVMDGKRLIGIITDRDICMAAYSRGRPLRELLVGDSMARQVFTCEPGDELATAEHIMQERQVRRLPVVDRDGHLVGIVSLADIASRRERYASPEELASTLGAICRPRGQIPVRAA